MDLRQRLVELQTEFVRRGAVQGGTSLDRVDPSQRAVQLSQNNLALLIRREEVDLELLKIYRTAVIALGVRDLTDHRSHKRPEDLPIIEQGYADEQALFEKHFPRNEFPSLY